MVNNDAKFILSLACIERGILLPVNEPFPELSFLIRVAPDTDWPDIRSRISGQFVLVKGCHKKNRLTFSQ